MNSFLYIYADFGEGNLIPMLHVDARRVNAILERTLAYGWSNLAVGNLPENVLHVDSGIGEAAHRSGGAS